MDRSSGRTKKGHGAALPRVQIRLQARAIMNSKALRRVRLTWGRQSAISAHERPAPPSPDDFLLSVPAICVVHDTACSDLRSAIESRPSSTSGPTSSVRCGSRLGSPASRSASSCRLRTSPRRGRRDRLTKLSTDQTSFREKMAAKRRQRADGKLRW